MMGNRGWGWEAYTDFQLFSWKIWRWGREAWEYVKQQVESSRGSCLGKEDVILETDTRSHKLNTGPMLQDL